MQGRHPTVCTTTPAPSETFLSKIFLLLVSDHDAPWGGGNKILIWTLPFTEFLSPYFSDSTCSLPTWIRDSLASKREVMNKSSFCIHLIAFFLLCQYQCFVPPFFYLFICLGITLIDTQEFLWLCNQELLVVLRGPYEEFHGSAVCKASALPGVLSLWPPFFKFLHIVNCIIILYPKL